MAEFSHRRTARVGVTLGRGFLEQYREIGRALIVAAVLCVFPAGSACRSESSEGGGRGERVASAEAAGARVGAKALRELTGARTRVVWVQDVGTGTDPFAQGNQLVLMGLDSDDGRGERRILPLTASYARPLITPRGDRVVFTNRQQRKVFVAGWDGKGLREVTGGSGFDVWADPESGVEWVYVGSHEGQREPGRYESVHRVQLDRPEVKELVWNRAPVSEDSFQVSADGRRASGVFPWPDGGVAQLPNRGLDRLGRGCWTSLASNGTDLFWVFDGAHRHVTMVDTQSGRRWQVGLNDAPGVDGHEVYHPRWSNHSRIFVLTGPYKGDLVGVNRIRSGGEAVEVHVGRFAADASSVEAWVQVTRNQRADFYPDVWVEPGSSLRAAAPAPAAGADPAPETASRWPVDRSGLLYVWENRSSANEIPGAEGEAPTACRAEPRDGARYGRHLEMDLEGGAFVALDAAERVANACRSSGQFTLEAALVPTRSPQNGAIVSLEAGSGAPDLRLSQEEDRLVLRLRVGTAGHESTLGRLRAGQPHHVVVSYTSGKLAAWLDGRETVQESALNGDLGEWQARHLLFGDVLAGGHGWDGTLEGVAIHDRATDADEVRRRFEARRERLAGRAAPKQVVVVARLVEVSGIPEPAAIAPYRRALAANRYEVLRVVEGRLEKDEVMAAHWVILDGEVLPSAARRPGERYRLTLEAFEERPDLEGERLTMDGDAFHLPLFYEVEGRALPAEREHAGLRPDGL